MAPGVFLCRFTLIISLADEFLDEPLLETIVLQQGKRDFNAL